MRLAAPGRQPKSKAPDQSRLTQFGQSYGMQPIWGWTVDSLVEALSAHMGGSFALSARLWEDMRSHPYIGHAVRQRQKVFTICPLNITPAEYRGEVRRSKRCADFVREIFFDVLPPPVRNDLLAHELGMGQAIYGINWECVRDGADRWWVPRVVPWDPGLVGYWMGQSNPDTADGGAFMATTQSHGVLKVEPGKGRWGMFSRRSLYPWLGGAVRTLGDSYVGDGYNFRDNQTHQDRWGRGIVKLFYPRQWNQQEVNAAAASLYEGGGGGVLQCPRGENGEQLVDADLLRADGSGWQTFDATERRIIQRILIALLRQDMLTTGKTGLAANDPRMVAAWECVEDDASIYGDAHVSSVVRDVNTRKATVPQWEPSEGPLRRDLWRWVAYFNFGDADLAPYTWWDATPYEEFERRLDGVADRGKKRASAIRDLADAATKLQGSADLPYLFEQCAISPRRPIED